MSEYKKSELTVVCGDSEGDLSVVGEMAGSVLLDQLFFMRVKLTRHASIVSEMSGYLAGT